MPGTVLNVAWIGLVGNEQVGHYRKGSGSNVALYSSRSISGTIFLRLPRS